MEFVESQTLEFKEQFNDSCKHTIVAFLSHGSGTIYIPEFYSWKKFL